MADPVHVLAAAEVRVPAPVHVDAGLAVGPPGRRADPEFVVEVRRRGGERFLPEGPGEIVVSGGQADLDPLDLADAAVADELRGLVEVLDRTLPRPRLPDAAVALDGVAESPALAQVVGQRLLAVDVEPGAQGRDGQDGVPVVGDGDGDGVEVLAEVELPEIVVSRAGLVAVLLVDHVLGHGQRLLVEVADGDPLDLGLLEEARHVSRPHHAEADAGHDDPVRRRDGAVLAQGRGLDDRREPGDGGGACDGGSLDELAAVHFRAFFAHAASSSLSQTSGVLPGMATGSTGFGPNSNLTGVKSSLEAFMAQSQEIARPV